MDKPSAESPNDSRNNQEVAGVVHKNTRTMVSLRQETEKQKGLQQRVAAGITRLVGSIPFVYFQALFIALWVLYNLGVIRHARVFDPFPFQFLGVLLATEAIFIAVLILVSQNRLSELEEKREELTLQVNLLTEHEVTRLISIVNSIAEKLKVDIDEPDIGELMQEKSPEKVLNVIEKEMSNLES